MRFLRTVAVAVVASATLAACASDPNVFASSQQMTAKSVERGTITSVRFVETRNMSSGDRLVGAVAGGAVGDLLGNQVGGGTGRTVATVAGTVAGAAAGDQIAQSANRQQSSQWTVTLDSGQMLAVIQNDPSLRVGARVDVIRSGNSTRLALSR